MQRNCAHLMHSGAALWLMMAANENRDDPIGSVMAWRRSNGRWYRFSPQKIIKRTFKSIMIPADWRRHHKIIKLKTNHVKQLDGAPDWRPIGWRSRDRLQCQKGKQAWKCFKSVNRCRPEQNVTPDAPTTDGSVKCKWIISMICKSGLHSMRIHLAPTISIRKSRPCVNVLISGHFTC